MLNRYRRYKDKGIPLEQKKRQSEEKLECRPLPHDADKMVMLVSDVTERYQKEEELKEARRSCGRRGERCGGGAAL